MCTTSIASVWILVLTINIRYSLMTNTNILSKAGEESLPSRIVVEFLSKYFMDSNQLHPSFAIIHSSSSRSQHYLQQEIISEILIETSGNASYRFLNNLQMRKYRVSNTVTIFFVDSSESLRYVLTPRLTWFEAEYVLRIFHFYLFFFQKNLGNNSSGPNAV